MDPGHPEAPPGAEDGAGSRSAQTAEKGKGGVVLSMNALSLSAACGAVIPALNVLHRRCVLLLTCTCTGNKFKEYTRHFNLYLTRQLLFNVLRNVLVPAVYSVDVYLFQCEMYCLHTYRSVCSLIYKAQLSIVGGNPTCHGAGVSV